MLEREIEEYSYDDHGNREYLTHSHTKTQVSESDIGGSYILYGEPKYTIPDQETCSYLAWKCIFFSQNEEYYEKHESLK